MAHLKDMLDRLPTLYRDGELLGGMLGSPALALEIFDEDILEVQRSHFFDTTLEIFEAEALAAILDIAAEPWQSLGEYRAWVHALRNARLLYGSVTVDAMTHFVTEYGNGFQRAGKLHAFPDILRDADAWIRVPAPLGGPSLPETRSPERRAIEDGKPLLLENPPVRRYQRIPASGGIEPLQQFTIDQRGLDGSVVSFLMTGLPGDPECVPAIINVTTGQALIYLDTLPAGKRLWLRCTGGGDATAELEGIDATARLRSVSGIVPGIPWTKEQVDASPKAMRLARGINAMWFLPIAHYDVPGLDRYLLALADLLLKQGRYDETSFNHALFYQSPAALLRMSWLETQPACFMVGLPSGAMLSAKPPNDSGQALARALENRDQLAASLHQGVSRLKGAGIDSAVELLPFSDVQRARDRLLMVLPMHVDEQGTMGADALTEAGGAYDVTEFEQSLFR